MDDKENSKKNKREKIDLPLFPFLFLCLSLSPPLLPLLSTLLYKGMCVCVLCVP
jgi:hypothetical protein